MVLFDSRKWFCSKATSIDGSFPPAWIGSGNAYAAQEESDQAMAAFRTGARLFPGYALSICSRLFTCRIIAAQTCPEVRFNSSWNEILGIEIPSRFYSS